jgi:hypothetical protein
VAYVKTDAMEKLICEALFRGRALPATWYIGLGTGPLPVETALLTDVVEVTGSGYEREALSPNDTDFPQLQLVNGDWKVSSKQLAFAAVGGDWTSADYAFLTDAASGTVGELYGVISIPSSITNLDGDTFNGTFEYQDS